MSAIAGELNLDRKTVRKHLVEAPQPYKWENPAACKIDPYRPFLRERWEKGVHNARNLLEEVRSRGYESGCSQWKRVVLPWREEGREKAFVRFDGSPIAAGSQWPVKTKRVTVESRRVTYDSAMDADALARRLEGSSAAWSAQRHRH